MAIKAVFFSKKSLNGRGKSKTPVCDTIELHQFTQHVSQFRHLHF